MQTIYLIKAANEEEQHRRHAASTPFAPILATMTGVIVWLIFILFYALDWSKNYSLFQNIVVFIVSVCVTAIVIGMMWIVWGRNRYHWWARQYWE
jgi:Kef-type K+ transport system membrane component KefB